MKVRSLVQLSLVALVWSAAYLDFKRPGYMQFYDPIPWSSVNRIIGSWGQCPSGAAVRVPGVAAIANLFKSPSTLEDWQRRLGQPTCHKDGVFIWKLSEIWGNDLYLKITFINNQATSYEFLRDSKTGPESTQRGSKIPDLGEGAPGV